MQENSLIENINRIHGLAIRFYAMMGYVHRDEHGKLYDSQHPTEQLVWAMACEAFEDIDGLDGWELLEELRNESNG